MSATADRPAVALQEGASSKPLAPAEGLELLGEVDGAGYQEGVSLVRRADGQMVQLGPLLYALLDELDGECYLEQLSEAMCRRLGRACEVEHVAAIAQKLAEQGLVAGSEANAPARANPLLALRWKVIVSDPALTRRLTAPFRWLFRPVVLLPVLAAFVGVCWYVLGREGLASGAAQAFGKPELILMLFGLGVASAAFHELGHASACRYGGGTPGGMGAGLYMVWPAFYTDVTDAYRLPKRARLRTDLGGLYFNSIVAVATFSAWLVLHVDALLLLIGLQLVEMVKQLSPVIRADGYHILSDVTGVPDLYAHIVPTLKRLVPGRGREPSALTGRARIIVTLWVLVVVPVLLSMMFSVILLLPRLATSTWVSGSHILSGIPDQVAGGAVVDVLVSFLRLLGLALPLLGGAYLAWRVTSGAARKGASWSRGRPARRIIVAAAAAAIAALLLWAWWPDGQYRPIRADEGGRLGQLVETSAPATSASAASGASHGAARSAPSTKSAAPDTSPAPHVASGTTLAMSLVPVGGPTDKTPTILVITDPGGGGDPIVIATDTGDGSTSTTATAFRFDLPNAPQEGDSQALAVNTTDGGVKYTVAYSLVTVQGGDAVDNQNSAYAFANCSACTTVAVSFQVVLVVGTSPTITPINFAEALNGNCPSCITAAIARQIVISVGSEPSPELVAQLNEELARLDALDQLGGNVTFDQLLAQVTSVQQGINQLLEQSGLVPAPTSGQDAAATADPADPSAEPAATDASTATTSSSEPLPAADTSTAPAGALASPDPSTSSTTTEPATSTTSTGETTTTSSTAP